MAVSIAGQQPPTIMAVCIAGQQSPTTNASPLPANSNYFQVSTGILTTGRCGTQRISVLMSIFFFYKHMTRYMDSGYVDATFQHGDNYELIALLIFQFISLGDAIGGRRGGCGGRFDDHGFKADVGLSAFTELSTAGLRNYFELSGWFDML